MNKMSDWYLEMVAEPVIPAWTISGEGRTSGAELQRAIMRGFFKDEESITLGRGCTCEKVFTFKEHGEFFRGALTMASIRYAGDFYDLLQRYGSIKVTITKSPTK